MVDMDKKRLWKLSLELNKEKPTSEHKTLAIYICIWTLMFDCTVKKNKPKPNKDQ